MKDLFKGELLRFRLWAIAAAVIHVGGLGFMARIVDLAQQPKLVYQVFAMIYAVAGMLLGLYQMGTYRRANHWLNLLHRPLHRLRIAAALCSAGFVLLALAVALPILAIAWYQDALTARVVDLRHWLLPVAALLIACCGYLAGAYAMLANRRYSAAAALLPAVFMFTQAAGVAALAVQALVLLMLAGLVGIAFKPQLDETPRHPLAVAAGIGRLGRHVHKARAQAGFAAQLGEAIGHVVAKVHPRRALHGQRRVRRGGGQRAEPGGHACGEHGAHHLRIGERAAQPFRFS